MNSYLAFEKKKKSIMKFIKMLLEIVRMRLDCYYMSENIFFCKAIFITLIFSYVQTTNSLQIFIFNSFVLLLKI